MTEEKQEEEKPIVQLQNLRKAYPEINEVQINKDIINQLLNSIYNSSNFGQKMEGVIFGRQTEKKLIVSTLIQCTITESANSYFVSYLDTSRLDNTKIGFYLCDNGEELLSRNKLKTFIEFQKIFPNCVILTVDINAVKANTYPFKCFRISNKIMDKFEEEEIEENIYLDKNTIKEFYKQMFKKLNSTTIDLIQPLKLTVGNDILNVFETFAEKEYVDDQENNFDNNYYYTKDINYNLNRKIKQLNKGCEKLIEEQKKYINFYKNKKINNESKAGKDENRKVIKTSGSAQPKGGNEEKFDQIDFGLYSQNIKEMNNAIRNIINKKEIDSFTAFNLA